MEPPINRDDIAKLVAEYHIKRQVAGRFFREFDLPPTWANLMRLLAADTPGEMREIAKSLSTPLDEVAALSEAETILRGA